MDYDFIMVGMTRPGVWIARSGYDLNERESQFDCRQG
jgi:hypothetical protein